MADNKDIKQNKTAWQNLNQMLNLDGTGSDFIQPEKTNDRVIIRGNTPQEIERKSLEYQQQNALRDKFFKTTDHGFRKAMQYEAHRLPAYLDYEGMEFYPIIASALDLLMEEATTIGNNGIMLNIYSDKERIKTHLEELFYDVINVNTNLPFWTRNLPIKHDSIIPMLDGTNITIKELSEQIKNNPKKEYWTYSIQDKTLDVVPGKIVWCDLTRKNTEIIRVNLDDNTYIETTPDHEYLLRNGKLVQAQNLKPNDSLMPFYTRKSVSPKDSINGYEKIYNPRSNHYKYTHSVVSHELHRNLKEEKEIGEKFVTHHIDFNKNNNHPSNLERLTNSKHLEIHNKHCELILQRPDVVEKRMMGIIKYLKSDSRKKYLKEKMSGIYPKYFKDYNNSEIHTEHNLIRKKTMLNLWSDDDFSKKVKDRMRIHLSAKGLLIIKNEIASLKSFVSKKDICQTLLSNNEFINELKLSNKIKRNLYKSVNNTTLEKLIFRNTGLSFYELALSLNPSLEKDKKFIKGYMISNSNKKTKLKKKILNHKVVSIERLSEKHDVYCMEVVGKNGEHDRHNFPVCSKDSNGNTTRNGIFVSNCKYGDNFVYLLGEKKKGITVVKQMVNFEMERIERIEKGKASVKFKQKITSDEFNLFEIAHFRLLGDDKYIPYGSSVLNKIRRVFRQLIMAEDAMLTYRIIRAGEKRVFKIDVGNIDDDDIESYIQRIAARFKKQQQVDHNTGQIDYRFNILGNDEDYIIPVKNANVETGVDTLPGAQNLDQIQDIEYLRDNLFTGLGIPKPFLGYQATAGEGKNLAQMDIRFSKKINRIQQALIQELNKMAVIHLYLLGFSKEDLNNFSLSLTNPSTQQEILTMELLQQKSQVYTELTRTEGGIAAMSHTEAKKRILNMSEKEIIDDLKKQFMERAVSQELQDAPLVIRQTGLFNDLNDKYGTGEAPQSGDTGQEEGEGIGEPNLPPLGGEDNVAAPQSPAELPPVIGQGKGFKESKPMISEKNYKKYTKRFENFIEEMVGVKNSATAMAINSSKSIIIENEKISRNLNEKVDKMTSEINALLEKSDSINTKNSISNRNFESKKINEGIDVLNLNVDDLVEKKNSVEKEKK